jgi:radical SAM protein with 4Fe4S-binding SPASM domain
MTETLTGIPTIDESVNLRPYIMQIETTTVCNATCWMCPRDEATRSNHKNRMDTEVFKSTVKQAVELGVTTILPFIDGEPLTDSRMVDFVEWMAAELPTNVTTGWYTNGSLLTEEKAYRLLRTKRIPHFNVSMQGGDKATYEKNMGLEWERTIKNVERLIEINRELGNPTQIRANMCVGGPSHHSVEAFKERWGRFEEVSICLGAYSNFGGIGKDEMGDAPWRDKPRLVCDRGTRHIYVFWNGDVGQCCFDLKGTIVYGNVKEQSLFDIWDGPKARKSRKAHWELDVKNMAPICVNCSACKFHG